MSYIYITPCHNIEKNKKIKKFTKDYQLQVSAMFCFVYNKLWYDRKKKKKEYMKSLASFLYVYILIFNQKFHPEDVIHKCDIYHTYL